MKKAAKTAGIILAVLIMLPFALIVLYIIFEIIGACANHAAGARQTSRFEALVRDSGYEILSEDTFVGNSGNGNHVDLVTTVFISSDESRETIEEKLSSFEGFLRASAPDPDDPDDLDYLKKAGLSDGEGVWLLTVFNPAPFHDNIEGH